MTCFIWQNNTLNNISWITQMSLLHLSHFTTLPNMSTLESTLRSPSMLLWLFLDCQLSIVWVLSEKCHVSNVSQLFSQWWLRLTTEEAQVERTQQSGDTGVLSLPGHYTAAWGTFMQASCTLQGVEVTRPSNPSKYVSPPAELSANPQIKVSVCPATTCGPYTIPLQRTALWVVRCTLSL